MDMGSPVWLAWDGGMRAVVGRGSRIGTIYDDRSITDGRTIVIMAGRSSAPPTTDDDTLIDAFFCWGNAGFVRPVNIPKDFDRVTVGQRAGPTIRILRSFHLKQDLSSAQRRLIWLASRKTERSAARPLLFSNLLHGTRHAITDVLARLAHNDLLPLWAASIPLVEPQPGKSVPLEVGPLRMEFPSADQGIRVKAMPYEISLHPAPQPQLHAPVVELAAIEREGFCAEIEVEVPYNELLEGDATRGIVVAHFMRQRMAFKEWSGSSGKWNMPTVTIDDIRQWLAEEGLAIETHIPASNQDTIVQPLVAQQPSPSSCIEVSIRDTMGHGRTQTAPVRGFFVKFKAAVRGDHLLVADIEGDRLIGDEGTSVASVGFCVGANELIPIDPPCDLGSPPYDVVHTAFVPLGESGGSATTPTQTTTTLRGWITRLSQGQGEPSDFDASTQIEGLLPLYALAFDLVERPAGSQHIGEQWPDFEDYLNDGSLAALLMAHPDLKTILHTLGAEAAVQPLAQEHQHLVKRLFAAAGRDNAIEKTFNTIARQLRAYDLVCGSDRGEALEAMLDASVCFDEGAADDLDAFKSGVIELARLLKDRDLIQTLHNRAQPDEQKAVGDYLAKRDAGTFVESNEIRIILPILQKYKSYADKIVRAIFEEDAVSGVAPPPSDERESFETLKAGFANLAELAVASSEPAIKREGERLNALASKYGAEKVFLRNAIDKLRLTLGSERLAEIEKLIRQLEEWAGYNPPIHLTSGAGSAKADRGASLADRIVALVRASRPALQQAHSHDLGSALGRAGDELAGVVAQRCDAMRSQVTEAENEILKALPDYARILMLHKAYKILEDLRQEILPCLPAERKGWFEKQMLLWPIFSGPAWSGVEEMMKRDRGDLVARMSGALAVSFLA